jgi:hypothetical protein
VGRRAAGGAPWAKVFLRGERTGAQVMLILIVGAVWLVAVVVVLAMCRVAACGDRALLGYAAPARQTRRLTDATEELLRRRALGAPEYRATVALRGSRGAMRSAAAASGADRSPGEQVG